MFRRGLPLVLTLGIGCSVAAPAESVPPIVEWHASERAYSLDPLREDVVVWADGRIEARFETAGVLSGWKEFAPQRKRIVLSPAQMDQLFVLLSEVDFLRGEPVDPRIAGCAVQPRDPDLVREVLLVYSPRPGVRRELRRSWGDGSLEAMAFTRECYARLERLDRFFAEQLLPVSRTQDAVPNPAASAARE